MKRYKYLIIILSSFIILVGLLVFFSIPGKDAYTTSNIIEINYPENGAKAFIYFKNLGISADHQMVFISGSKNENFTPNESADYIYKGVDALYYKQQKDTLFIYCAMAPAIPVNYSGAIKIVQIELGNIEMMDLYHDDNYLKKGLHKVQ
ncbi:hypothetical protein [Chitinophaga sancti]|uniref:Uncharacterized protein n=1 Tax=Chitinophaga sancti TaxID=1004 RepID=A0A1K1SM09_9BACT|nr:hypothetical protein [Chitinophaga sancti]WQD63928.1 hypothetical protein U0033_05930 [Chitinophaga sancti]WQG90447.1 hypothetical protein SR876_02990 [Chitinophaga sancti]SFW85456.1 hypothetical protein SAMN05661012_05745 [Chitinophaga sancti]